MAKISIEFITSIEDTKENQDKIAAGIPSVHLLKEGSDADDLDARMDAFEDQAKVMVKIGKKYKMSMAIEEVE